MLSVRAKNIMRGGKGREEGKGGREYRKPFQKSKWWWWVSHYRANTVAVTTI